MGHKERRLSGEKERKGSRHCEERHHSLAAFHAQSRSITPSDRPMIYSEHRKGRTPPLSTAESTESLEQSIRRAEGRMMPPAGKRDIPRSDNMEANVTAILSKTFLDGEDPDEPEWLARVMSKPRHFKGTRTASWSAQMALYMGHRCVPDRHKVTVATSYLDERTMDWYTIALGREEQRKDWEEFKETLLRHISARNCRQAQDHLTRTRQTGTVRDYLSEFNEALAECPGLPEEEKKKTFVNGLRPSIAMNIRSHDRLTMTQIIDLAVRMSYDPAQHKHDGRPNITTKAPRSPKKRQVSSDSEEGGTRRENRWSRRSDNRGERLCPRRSHRPSGGQERPRRWGERCQEPS